MTGYSNSSFSNNTLLSHINDMLDKLDADALYSYISLNKKSDEPDWTEQKEDEIKLIALLLFYRHLMTGDTNDLVKSRYFLIWIENPADGL